MKIKQVESKKFRTRFLIRAFFLWILASLATGCGPQPIATISPPDQTPLPSLTPVRPGPSLTPIPSPSLTPTLELINSGLVYTVVGLPAEEALAIHQEPNLGAAITGEIPPGGNSIQTTGIEIQTDGISWLQIVYQGSAGWVNRSYLALQRGDLPEQLTDLSMRIAAALKEADYNRLAPIIHPDLCLRFSPYPHLRTSDLTFCPEQLAELPGSINLFNWGQYDGSGEPIELSFDAYHQRFVYDQDYLQPQVVGLNQEVSSGNAINNIPIIFPSGIFVEYHFPGFDPQYGGMDWRSLRMVFIQKDGNWYLVALVHGEWTI
jgi:hypothetical protein